MRRSANFAILQIVELDMDALRRRYLPIIIAELLFRRSQDGIDFFMIQQFRQLLAQLVADPIVMIACVHNLRPQCYKTTPPRASTKDAAETWRSTSFVRDILLRRRLR
ncbi:hypothetical protein H9L39_07906 [Fusarium oxysporum f. sp. albedinis]|nr:hypothetical protein H9L39_18585 [Fusarium oxysporum f. sp. albedinis]KAK2480338.1 hypothetical protein H9L39_07906 [Fusarium oxysporum f. sp. albedinis]